MDKLTEYAQIKGRIKALEAQLDELKAEVMDEIYTLGDGTKSYTNKLGTFAVMERRFYEYPPEIIGKEAELKAMKKEYEGSKEAVLKSVTAYPSFFEKKEDK